MSAYYQQLVNKLEELFGTFDEKERRFSNANNSAISRELGYSDAQFSRLINGTATENEYHRANKNIDRILKIQRLEEQAQSGDISNRKASPYIWRSLAAIFFAISCLLLMFQYFQSQEIQRESIIPPRDHTLKWAFESSFINPFVKLNDLPADCDYPCYKYQGKWQLDGSYKLPFFRERNGFHYLATEVEMYGRCMMEKSEKGDIIEGYEYQKHEIWYDKEERAIDSFMTNTNTPSEDYQNLDFEQQPNFVKVAIIHTFFRNEFTLQDSTIHRIGKVIGRDMERIPKESLQLLIDDEKKINDLVLQLSKIANNRLEDFSVPIVCADAPLIAMNPANIEDGDKMSFQCQLTTGGFPITYVKTYVLRDQYIKNDCIPAN